MSDDGHGDLSQDVSKLSNARKGPHSTCVVASQEPSFARLSQYLVNLRRICWPFGAAIETVAAKELSIEVGAISFSFLAGLGELPQIERALPMLTSRRPKSSARTPP